MFIHRRGESAVRPYKMNIHTTIYRTGEHLTAFRKNGLMNIKRFNQMQRTFLNSRTRTFVGESTQPSVPSLPRLPLLATISLVIIGLVTLPLLYLVIRALGAGQEGLSYLFQPRTLTIVTNSLLLAGAVMFSSVVLGVPFAWLTSRTDLPFRRVWLILGLMPMVIPSYLGAITFVAAFGPVGMLQNLLEPFGVTRLPSIYGFFGAWAVITLFTYPYVVLPVRAALLNLDPALEEAGRSLGLNRWRLFWRVTLPQLRPALAAGMLLTALYTLSDFGAVMIMKYNAFTRAIYINYNSSFDRERGALLALVLVALTLVLLLMEKRVSATTRNYRIGVGAQRRASTVALGKWRVPSLIFCGTLVTVGVIIPVGILIAWALNGNVQSRVEVDMNLLSVNTVLSSGLTALVVGLAALPLAILAVRHTSRFSRVLVSMSYFGNVLPGIVIALALVFFAANYTPSIYQTLPLLVLGYATRFLPFGVSATRSALTQINPRLEEAGRCLGLKPHQITLRITAPLARAGILGGMALVFLNAMKELPTTLILSPIGFDTLATRIWTASESALQSLIGAPGLILMAVSCLSLVVILWRDDRTAE